jgi:hypothetical protein
MAANDSTASPETASPKTAADIATSLQADAMELHTFFRTVERLTYSEKGEVEDHEVHTIAERGAQLDLCNALNQFHLDLHYGKVTQPAREVPHV